MLVVSFHYTTFAIRKTWYEAPGDVRSLREVPARDSSPGTSRGLHLHPLKSIQHLFKLVVQRTI